MTAPHTRAPAPGGDRDGRDSQTRNGDDGDRSAQAEIRSGLGILLSPCGVHELRILKAGRARTVSGCYDDLDALARDAERWDGRAPGIYVTLNPCADALLARSANRARENAEITTSDKDIARRTRLFVDLDPVRPSGIASTDTEHEAALDRARAIRADLRELGWPEPLLIDSGNGAYLIFGVDLPNDSESTEIVSGTLRGLASRYSDDQVAIDTTVSNAARIVRIPGTANRKGDDTPDRPHRRCRIVDAPDTLEIVDVDALRMVAAWAPAEPARPASGANGSMFDIDSFMAAHGLEILSDQPWDGKRRIKLARCPFNAEHVGGSAALFVFASGAISFRCQHDSCAGRKWANVRELFEPARQQQHDAGERVHARDADDDLPPIPSGRPWPAPLGDAAYHGPLGAFVRMIEPHTEADPAALLLQALAGFGSLCGRNRYYEVEETKHFPNLFVCIVGETSKGRKGTSWSRTEKLLRGIDDTWQLSSGLSSGEGLTWAVRDAITKQEAIKQRGAVVGYQEIEVDPGIDDKRLLVLEGEFASPLKVMSREGNTLSQIIRWAWDRGDLRSLVKNSPARATGAHVSIIGHVTDGELRLEMDACSGTNGFANRFLFVGARRSKELPFGGFGGGLDYGPILRRLGDAFRLAQEPGEMRFDAAARERWIETYSALSAGRPGLFGAVTGRSEAQVVRLSLIFALADGAAEISLPHLDAALEAWRYCSATAGWIFGTSLGDRIADTALAAIREAGAKGVTRTELRDLLGKGYGERLTRALATLESAGLSHPVRVTTAGRPAERWYPGRITPDTTPTPEAPKAPKGGGAAESAGPSGASGALGMGGLSDEHEPPPPDDDLAPDGSDADDGGGWEDES